LKEIITSVEAEFDACRKEYGINNLVGYAICLDDTGIMFSPIANLQEHISITSETDKLNAIYNPENWKVQSAPIKGCSIGEKINEMYEWCEDYDNDENWHEEFRSRVYQLSVRTLEGLMKKGYFEMSDNHPFVTVWVIDSEVPFARATSWVKRLNNKPTQIKFANWLEALNN